MKKKKKSKKTEGQKPKFEISNLLFAQITSVLIILIILLFIRLLHMPTFKGIMTEYNNYFGEDIPLSVLAENVFGGAYYNNTEEQKTTESETAEETTVPTTKPTADPDEEIPDDEAEPTTVKATEKIESVSVTKSSATSKINEMELPVKKGRVSSEFGYRVSPITGKYGLHDGVDLAAPMGTEIYAALDGTVIASVEDEEIGYYVKIDHGNGVVTAYGHCSKLIAKEGDKVKKGDVIALVGSTGRSTGPHTHFEVRVDGTKINPAWVVDLSKLNAA